MVVARQSLYQLTLPLPTAVEDIGGTMSERCVFHPCSIKAWGGRYSRIPGESSVFHVRTVVGQPRVVIEWCCDDSTGTCVALRAGGVNSLIEAVQTAKRMLGGGPGGSFQVNEYGQVLVPASDGQGRVVLVGELEGPLLFRNPFEDDTLVDLSDADGLAPGDPWNLPYVGMPYHLHRSSRIYHYQQTDDGGQSEFPTNQDYELIRALRSVRRSGAVRFIVNPYGLVLTKMPPQESWQPEEKWEPVFVGRLNRRLWFEREE